MNDLLWSREGPGLGSVHLLLPHHPLATVNINLRDESEIKSSYRMSSTMLYAYKMPVGSRAWQLSSDSSASMLAKAPNLSLDSSSIIHYVLLNS